jgi:hypothetical protein
MYSPGYDEAGITVLLFHKSSSQKKALLKGIQNIFFESGTFHFVMLYFYREH